MESHPQSNPIVEMISLIRSACADSLMFVFFADDEFLLSSLRRTSGFVHQASPSVISSPAAPRSRASSGECD